MLKGAKCYVDAYVCISVTLVQTCILPMLAQLNINADELGLWHFRYFS